MLNTGGYKNYSITVSAAQANFGISPAIGAGQFLEVIDLYATLDAGSPAAGTAVRIGFGASSLVAASTTEFTPATGILLDHPGALPGSQLIGTPGKGAEGEELRITNEVPTGGSIIITYLGAIRSSK